MANKNPYLRQNLRIAPVQKLTLTPALLQKIELLKLSHLELSEFIKGEMMQNPFLEEGMDSGGPESLETAAAQERSSRNGENSEASAATEGMDEADYNAFFDDYLEPGYRQREYEDYEKPGFETFAVKPTSLYEHLAWQLNLEDLSPAVEAAARCIIGNINEEGYLQVDEEEIARTAREMLQEDDREMEVTGDDIEQALDVVQHFDPPGIGARNLQECLLSQLVYWKQRRSLAYRILENHLDLLEAGQMDALAEVTGTTLQDVQEAVERIRHLNPKPGLQYKSDATIYIQPDVYIYKVGQDYVISLNEDGLPKLYINPYYRRILQSGRARGEERKFIREKFKSAIELIRNLDHRKRTIYRVCEIIVAEQRDFLDRGFSFLKPMLLKDVAEQLGLHTSTISRAVTNKWVHCPQGILELRSFFTLGFKTDDGEDISVHNLKQKISDLIEAEDKRRPLSDSDITSVLNRDGIDIKRRTVAKYREELEIPNSRDRRIKK